jgi:PAS domain S-box-containing protein
MAEETRSLDAIRNGARSLEVLRHLFEGVLVLDRSLRIRSASKKVEDLTGWRPQDLIGAFCYEVMKTDRCERECLALEAIRNGHTYLHVPVEVRAGTDLRWIDTSVLPLRGVNGEIVGAEVLFRDYEDLASRAQVIEPRTPAPGYQVLHEALMNVLQEGVVILDDMWRIIEFSNGAERITGYRRGEVLGKSCSEVLDTDLCDTDCPMKKAFYLEEPIKEVEIRLHGKHGRALAVLANTAPLKDAGGDVVGGVLTWRDVSGLEWMRRELASSYDYRSILGNSVAMREVYRRLEDVASTDTTVLIQGETGTGRELVARVIHLNSDRRERPFVSVNCSSLPESAQERELFGHVRGAYKGAVRDKEGRFEFANGGTLFLDEVGALSPATQVRLLQLIEEKIIQRVGDTKSIRVDVRLIASTDRELRSQVETDKFRGDLYYRLSVFPIEVPPLRERMEDLPVLVHHMIDKFNQQMGKKVQGISGEAMDALYAYSWPGNARELENALEHAFVHSRGLLIQMEDLPGNVMGTRSEHAGAGPDIREETMDSFERGLILRHLEEAHWRRGLAAKRLGISPVTLWRKMKKYGIHQSFLDEK